MKRRTRGAWIAIALVSASALAQQTAPPVDSAATGVVWLFNSDTQILRYRNAQSAFLEEWTGATRVIDLADVLPTRAQVERWRREDRPRYIVCIGSKALQVASRLSENEFIAAVSVLSRESSSFPTRGLIVDARPHPESELMLARTYFPRLRSIGVVCHERINGVWAGAAKAAAERVGIKLDTRWAANGREAVEIIGQEIHKWDALWIVPDPEILESATHIEAIFERARAACRPVITYTSAFSKFNPALIIESDDATGARQVADSIRRGFAADLLTIQPPAGTRVILNLREPARCGIEWNSDALDTVNELIR